jgi:hypothetical protein
MPGALFLFPGEGSHVEIDIAAAMLIYIKQQHQVIDLQVAMGGIVNWSAKGVAIFVIARKYLDNIMASPR